MGWGADSFGQSDVPSRANSAFAVASGYYHSLALVPSRPRLQPYLTHSGLIIRWNGNGVLQWAPTPIGPYNDVPSQGNAYTNTDLSAPAKFFRLGD
jgi:hypothetical protein